MLDRISLVIRRSLISIHGISWAYAYIPLIVVRYFIISRLISSSSPLPLLKLHFLIQMMSLSWVSRLLAEMAQAYPQFAIFYTSWDQQAAIFLKLFSKMLHFWYFKYFKHKKSLPICFIYGQLAFKFTKSIEVNLLYLSFISCMTYFI